MLETVTLAGDPSLVGQEIAESRELAAQAKEVEGSGLKGQAGPVALPKTSRFAIGSTS